jgi:hypothetical protein
MFLFSLFPRFSFAHSCICKYVCVCMCVFWTERLENLGVPMVVQARSLLSFGSGDLQQHDTFVNKRLIDCRLTGGQNQRKETCFLYFMWDYLPITHLMRHHLCRSRLSQLCIGLTCSWNYRHQLAGGAWLVGDDQGHATQTQPSNNRERTVWTIYLDMR